MMEFLYDVRYVEGIEILENRSYVQKYVKLKSKDLSHISLVL